MIAAARTCKVRAQVQCVRSDASPKDIGMPEEPLLAIHRHDSDAARRAVDRSASALRVWRGEPSFRGLAARLDAAGGDAQAVAEIAGEVLADDAVAHRFVSIMLNQVVADPFFTPPLPHVAGIVGDGVRLFKHRNLEISLAVVHADALAAKKCADHGGRAIAFSGNIVIRRVLRAGGAMIQRFVAEPAGSGFSLATHPPCRIAAREALASGRTFTIDGRFESFTFLHAHAAVAYLECKVLAGEAPFRVEYDADTLRPVAASSTDQAASRAQLMLSAMRALGGVVDPSVYDGLLGHRCFDTRWHAMRELMLVNPAEAWPRLHRLANTDPHREIRVAAARAVVTRGAGVASCHE